MAANSFMEIQLQNYYRKEKGAVPEGRAPDDRSLFAIASVADERSEPDGADVLLGEIYFFFCFFGEPPFSLVS